VDANARDARVVEVMTELGLEERQNLVISRLSGGQRKRTSVASELLTKPSLLFLDEPTSGLDPGSEEQVTSLLRELADGGRTVVVATHSLVTLERCDRVLFLARGGFEAFFGPPDVAMTYFDEHGFGESYPRVFASLGEPTGGDFATAFANDPASSKYVNGPVSQAVARVSAEPNWNANARPRSDRVRQWGILVRRYVAVLLADPASTLILLAQAPFFALLFVLLYPNNVLTTARASGAGTLSWLLVLGATWIGTSNAIREIVKERAILSREYGIGLSLGAYLGSKVAVLGGLTAIQCAFLALATMLRQSLPAVDPSGQFVFPPGGVFAGDVLSELVLDVVLAGLASMGIGLLVSAIVRNADQANFALPLLLVAQVVLSAPLLTSPGPVYTALGTASTAQWGTAAVASTIGLNDVQRPYLIAVTNQRAAIEGVTPDLSAAQGPERWNHQLAAWLGNLLALVVIAMAAIIGLNLALAGQLRTRIRSRAGP
jgi:energy-coupling factor transporter ATP-binding protein EcfA2